MQGHSIRLADEGCARYANLAQAGLGVVGTVRVVHVGLEVQLREAGRVRHVEVELLVPDRVEVPVPDGRAGLLAVELDLHERVRRALLFREEIVSAGNLDAKLKIAHRVARSRIFLGARKGRNGVLFWNKNNNKKETSVGNLIRCGNYSNSASILTTSLTNIPSINRVVGRLEKKEISVMPTSFPLVEESTACGGTTEKLDRRGADKRKIVSCIFCK